jgi:hypothetical protein
MKISVKVKPGAREEKVEEIDGGYKVSVKSIAEGGRANDELIETLSEYFDVAKSRIKIISGFGAKNKIVEIK